MTQTIWAEGGFSACFAVPFERIRPANIPQGEWEERFAWPANNKPPYLPLVQRIVRGVIGYVIVIVGTAAALQVFTPFPVLTWLGEILKTLRPYSNARASKPMPAQRLVDRARSRRSTPRRTTKSRPRSICINDIERWAV